MEVISIERSTYEELLTSFNSFVAQMKAMASRGKQRQKVGRMARQPGRMPDTEHQSENITDAQGQRDISLFANRT